MRTLIAALASAFLLSSAPAVAAPDTARIQFETVVMFNPASARLTAQAKAMLDDVFDKSGELDPELIMAIGHTDASVRPAPAQKLSIRRAEAVKTYLAARGFDRKRIYTEGKGARLPLAGDGSAAARAGNNRVEVQIIGPRVRPDDGEDGAAAGP